jgi:phosphoribosylformylglycinamidine (FGAM) synthase-like enzyme
VVGQIEKAEYVTTQWFKDEGDVILLLGDVADGNDGLLGLGGSAYLQNVLHLKTGTPPRCDMERERALHNALRGFIYSGIIKSAHDCSEGGLAVALAESCISQQVARETPRLIGANIDLSATKVARLDALLFGESQSRVVVSVSPLDANKILERAKILEVPAMKLGTVGGTDLVVKTPTGEFKWSTSELHDQWWNSIARVMQ